jgi:hypothetical protein
MKTLSISEKYSEFTGLRHCDISDNSGEDFYHKILNQEFKEAFISKEKLIVILDKVDGYASSFLDEAFGNLVYDFTLENVKKYVQIISSQEPHWKEMIENRTYIQWENRRKDAQAPKVTEKHNPWYRLINNELKLKIWEQPAVV